MRTHLTVGIVISTAVAVCWGASLTDTLPPGLYFPLDADAHKTAETFIAGRPIIGTTYFYWYDVYSGAHLRNPDGTDALTHHPPAAAMADFSYKSVHWHYSQLRDMREADIDFILPVFWGTPGRYDTWSFTGLAPLLEAHNRMLAEHKADASRPLPPKIGLFYDTSTLEWNAPASQPHTHVDLTTRQGRDWFYTTIRDYFSLIPPDKWARVDGKPIVFLYGADHAKAVDEKLFDDTQTRFQRDFATRMFLVRNVDWPGRADAWYAWGGAIQMTMGDVVAGVGPGYDHSAVPGRKPLVVDRQGGVFYARQWEQLLRMKVPRRPWMVHVETWNEWHEGTEIARSEEFGDLYLRLTAKYAAMFRAGDMLEPAGPFAQADRLRWAGRHVGGLDLRPASGDGCWEAGTIDGSPAVTSVPCPADSSVAYLYFRVDDSHLFDETAMSAEVTVVFRDDGGCERFAIEYDNNDPAQSIRDGAFRPTLATQVTRTGTWRSVRLILPNVRFVGRTNNSDLRLAITGGARRLTLRELLLRKLPGGEVTPTEAETPR